MGLFDTNPFGDNGSGVLGGGLELLFGSLTPAQTEPRSLYDEAAGTLSTEARIAPGIYQLASQYSPQYADLSQGIFSNVLRGVTGSSGADPRQAALLGEMNSQALGELQLGATLDPSLAREVQQSVRAGQAARGMGYGPTDVYQEAMQIGSAGQALRQQRRNYAGQVAGANIANMQPYIGAAYQMTQSGLQQFDPWNPYAADLYNTNFNAEAARNIAGAANRASMAGATIGAAGQVGAALINDFKIMPG